MGGLEEGTGFKIMSMGDFRKLKYSTLDPKPKVVFVNQRKALQPFDDTLKQYRDWMRRFSDKPPHVQKSNALRASRYDGSYRRKLFKYPESVALIRKLAEQSRKRLVLLVQTRDTPDAEIIVSIAKTMGWL